MMTDRQAYQAMRKQVRLVLSGLAVLAVGGASPLTPGPIPGWLLGDWTPVDIRQSADMLYPSPSNEPKHWLANQHLVVTEGSLTLADDRCEIPAVVSRHERPTVPLHENGGGTLESFDYPIADKPIEHLTFKCSHELHKSESQTNFVSQDDRGIPISWHVIVRSHNEIDLPFFGGSYVKFKRTSPTS